MNSNIQGRNRHAQPAKHQADRRRSAGQATAAGRHTRRCCSSSCTAQTASSTARAIVSMLPQCHIDIVDIKARARGGTRGGIVHVLRPACRGSWLLALSQPMQDCRPGNWQGFGCCSARHAPGTGPCAVALAPRRTRAGTAAVCAAVMQCTPTCTYLAC
jgi:hypothetical protein